MRSNFLLLSFCIFYAQASLAQDILGGELWAGMLFPGSLLVETSIEIFRENSNRPRELMINWGDGVIEPIYGQTTPLSQHPNIVVDVFHPMHYYEQPGLYVISVKDSFLVPDIVNIENSGEKYLTLVDTLRLLENGVPTVMPEFGPSPFNFSIDPQGVITLPSFYFLFPGAVYDSTSESLTQFVDEGYFFPEATDTIFCCRPVIWDQPLHSGRFAFSIHVNLWYQQQLISTGTRKMTINVDSSMLINTNFLLHKGMGRLLLFPNPTTHTLHLLVKGIQAESAILTIQNTAGQLLHQEEVALPSGLQQHQVDVSSWPPGVYFLRLQAGGRQVVRRFVKTGTG